MTAGAGDAHPGFGAFAKAHREFFDALGPDGWQPVAGYCGVAEKILSGRLDPVRRTGALTRLSRWEPGARVETAVSHAWCEEVFIISGTLSIGLAGGLRIGQADGPGPVTRLGPGTYACRPADIPHGPFFSETGCLMIEFTYFPPI
ncbi:cupin [Phreatobacter sp. AB_2022a]|uniref:cupin n=1 Tax=Phreatobacter sp. AB_2022a TaxID=3003134 RepID=UPI0022875170|nr:cupin [Phreatobacter sp. AB_2022a]MCZ0736128.1 cupin [Phreatobacter sp. AB_2022a]